MSAAGAIARAKAWQAERDRFGMGVRWPAPEASQLLADRELQMTKTRWAGDDEEQAEGKIIMGTVPPAGPLLEPGSGVTLFLRPAPTQ